MKNLNLSLFVLLLSAFAVGSVKAEDSAARNTAKTELADARLKFVTAEKEKYDFSTEAVAFETEAKKTGSDFKQEDYDRTLKAVNEKVNPRLNLEKIVAEKEQALKDIEEYEDANFLSKGVTTVSNAANNHKVVTSTFLIALGAALKFAWDKFMGAEAEELDADAIAAQELALQEANGTLKKK